MNAWTSNIEADKQSVLISIEKGQVPCAFQQKNSKAITYEFLSVAKNGDESFTPATPEETDAIKELIENEELVEHPMPVKHFDRSYRVIVPPMTYEKSA